MTTSKQSSVYGVADELVLTFVTLRNRDLVDRLQAAGIAGFQGIGWRLEDFTETPRQDMKEEDLVKLVLSSKVTLPEIEFFREWVGLERDADYQEKEAHLLKLADRLGASRLQVAVYAPQPVEKIVTSFRALCRRAASHNLTAQLEFMPYTPPVNSLRSAWDIIHAVDEPNAALLIDAWHWARTPGSAETLSSIPPERITSIQLGDVLPMPMPEVTEESRHHRCIPGTGALDLPLFLRTLIDHGVRAPLSVEVMSDELDALPAIQAAQNVARGTRSVLWNAMRQSKVS